MEDVARAASLSRAASHVAEEELLAERLGGQRLSGPPASDAVDLTRHLLAVQGQDPRGAQDVLRFLA